MWNTRDTSIADEVLDPGWVDHNHPEVTGIDDVKRAVGNNPAGLRFRVDDTGGTARGGERFDVPVRRGGRCRRVEPRSTSPGRVQLVEPDRDLVQEHHPPVHPPRHVHLGHLSPLIARIRDYVMHWNTDAEPFTWTATTDEILAKVRWIQTSIKQLVENNTK